MGKQMRKSPWLCCSLGSLLGFALASGTALWPSQAMAQNPTEAGFIKGCEELWSSGNKVAGFISKGASGYDFAVKALQFLGFLDSPLNLDDLKAEMLRIAQYQDWQLKQGDVAKADNDVGVANDAIKYNSTVVLATNFDPTSSLGIEIASFSDLGVREALGAELTTPAACPSLRVFQDLSKDTSYLTNYDWRAGITEGLKAVASRLLAIAVLDKTFKTDGRYNGELNDLRTCLTAHRDLIHPPRPFSFCGPIVTGGPMGNGCLGQLNCAESRPWVPWHIDQSGPINFPLCDDYYRGTSAGNWIPSYASQVAFADLEAIVASKIDHDNLPVVFALQRMIDSLYVITSGQPDLTETTSHIRFGANRGLCLSLKHPTGQGAWLLSLDSCSSSSPLLNWSYDRATGEISNLNTGLCLRAQGALTAAAPTAALQMSTCTNTDPAADSDELQVWDWNPETGIIKNPLGPVLAVADTIPQVGSLVSAALENPWHLNQQAWANGAASSCTGAACPAPGLAAWSQGPIPGTAQTYPKNFSVFSYMGADVVNTDVAGPVAAWGAISAQSFSINAASHVPDPPPVALVAGLGNLNLSVGGTINGTIYAGPKRSDLDGNMTIASSVWGAGKPIRTNPINFEMAFENLQGMSTTLSKYPTSGTVLPGVVMTLSSQNSKLAVFSVKGSDLSQARTIQFKVPATATVLINVSGTGFAIQNAGISSGQLDPSSMLWNFYQATSFTMASITLPGSVLAPLAAAELVWGAVNGTMAAWSIQGASEFHWYPFHNNALVLGP